MIKDEGLKAMAIEMFGMTDEDMEKVTPEMEQELVNAMGEIGNYRLVAEVINSKCCFAGLQPGQKFVIDNAVQINPEESTAPMCLGAIQPLYERGMTLLDRIYHKSDITAHVTGFRCTDPGLDLGGLGTVEFKVRAEKK